MNEEQYQKLQTARQYVTATPVMLPLLQKRRQQVMSSMLSAYRDGQTEFIQFVAELSVIRSMERELEQRDKELKQLEKELNDGG